MLKAIKILIKTLPYDNSIGDENFTNEPKEADTKLKKQMHRWKTNLKHERRERCISGSISHLQ